MSDDRRESSAMTIATASVGSAVAVVGVVIVSCAAPNPRRSTPPRVESSAQRRPSFQPDSLKQIQLGRRLFSDPALSRDSSTSCATCHSPFRAFTEPRAVSHGVGLRARVRNAPSLLDVALHHPPFDWDGRAESLDQQLRGIFTLGGDMDIGLQEVVKRVAQQSSYTAAFRDVYGRPPDVEGFIRALVGFEESLIDGESRFDRYYLRGDSTAFSASEKRGWRLFRSVKAGCAGCHVPLPEPKLGVILFQDYRFHNLGVGYRRRRMGDVGRFAVTSRPADWGAFRTPSLRNVALTAPYMHDGSVPTLEDVVAFYTHGGVRNPNRDPVIVKRALTRRDRADLVAFLRTLSVEWLVDSAAVGEKLLREADSARVAAVDGRSHTGGASRVQLERR